ncbi:AT-rich interactive domain-containing protein 1A-like isoform X10 [Sycon ciliatum]
MCRRQRPVAELAKDRERRTSEASGVVLMDDQGVRKDSIESADYSARYQTHEGTVNTSIKYHKTDTPSMWVTQGSMSSGSTTQPTHLVSSATVIVPTPGLSGQTAAQKPSYSKPSRDTFNRSHGQHGSGTATDLQAAAYQALASGSPRNATERFMSAAQPHPPPSTPRKPDNNSGLNPQETYSHLSRCGSNADGVSVSGYLTARTPENNAAAPPVEAYGSLHLPAVYDALQDMNQNKSVSDSPYSLYGEVNDGVRTPSRGASPSVGAMAMAAAVPAQTAGRCTPNRPENNAAAPPAEAYGSLHLPAVYDALQDMNQNKSVSDSPYSLYGEVNDGVRTPSRGASPSVGAMAMAAAVPAQTAGRRTPNRYGDNTAGPALQPYGSLQQPERYSALQERSGVPSLREQPPTPQASSRAASVKHPDAAMAEALQFEEYECYGPAPVPLHDAGEAAAERFMHIPGHISPNQAQNLRGMAPNPANLPGPVHGACDS